MMLTKRFQKAIQHLQNWENKAQPSFQEVSDELDRDFEKEHLDTVKLYLWNEFQNSLRKDSRMFHVI